jgi:hypothetical protein
MRKATRFQVASVFDVGSRYRELFNDAPHVIHIALCREASSDKVIQGLLGTGSIRPRNDVSDQIIVRDSMNSQERPDFRVIEAFKYRHAVYFSLGRLPPLVRAPGCC